ncbi:MAG: DUF2207 domain-containing protein [Aestuariivirga sp.]
MRAFFFALLALVVLNSGVQAEERIERFTSDAQVNADGSVDVTEQIVVNAESREIRHGILRDFPTTYTDRNGIRVVVGFDVVSVKRDGRSEPYAIEGLSNGKRIRIGSADTFVSYGLHTYEIRYRTTRQLGFFAYYDELYWNVTGNGWTLPIKEATAIVHLPAGAKIIQHSAYTGYQGEDGHDFKVLSATGNEYRAVSTREFGTGEGMTIAVAWQKGVVAAPSNAQKYSWFLRDNAGFIGLLATLAGVGLFYFYAWTRVGRDPPRGVVVPLFAPPPALGPAGCRFIWKQNFDQKAFAAALVGLAVKGRLKIADKDGDYEITKLQAQGPALTSAENTLFSATPSGTTALENSNHAAIGMMKEKLEDALTWEFEGSVFVRNIGWFWAGAALSIAGLLLSVLLMPEKDSFAGLFAAGWSGIWWGVILTIAWSSIKGIISGRGLITKMSSAASLLFLIPFGIAGVAVPVFMIFSKSLSPGIVMLVGTAIGLGIMNLVFYRLLRAPTLSGRKVLDQLEGFRMYMATAEEERLKVLNPPEKTPELFERYLPYALALDCENEWNDKFTAVLAAAALAGAAAPVWYSGSNWNSGNMGGFTESLGSGLATSAASAAQAPGSSSSSGGGFSGGGGSSGGGGGGGGGGGW